MKRNCYILKNDWSHVGDPGYDAECLSVTGGEDKIGPNMMSMDDFDVPEHLYYLADFDNIPEYDYPVTPESIPVISKKMLDTLLGVGLFKNLIIPVTMMDHCYLDDSFDSNGKIKEDVPIDKSYIALQIKEYTEAFDLEASNYDKDEVFGDPVGVIHKMVLKEPKEGFPPLFKIKEDRTYLFLSQEAKDALEAAGIKGCLFEKVEVSN